MTSTTKPLLVFCSIEQHLCQLCQILPFFQATKTKLFRQFFRLTCKDVGNCSCFFTIILISQVLFASSAQYSAEAVSHFGELAPLDEQVQSPKFRQQIKKISFSIIRSKAQKVLQQVCVSSRIMYFKFFFETNRNPLFTPKNCATLFCSLRKRRIRRMRFWQCLEGLGSAFPNKNFNAQTHKQYLF